MDINLDQEFSTPVDLNKEFETKEPHEGSIADAFYTHNSPISNILSTIGQSAQDGWGALPTFADQFAQDALKKANLYKNYVPTHEQQSKAFNEAFIRPAARAFMQTPLSIPFQAVQAGMGLLGAIGGAGTAIGSELIREAKATQERNQKFGGTDTLGTNVQGEIGEGMQAVFSGQLPIFEGARVPDLTPQQIVKLKEFNGGRNPSYLIALNKARSEGKLGEGDVGFYNTKPPSDENLLARERAAKEAGATAPVVQPLQKDIESLVREIDPYTFQEHDKLIELQENLRSDIQRLGNLRGKDTEDSILNILAQGGGHEGNLSDFQAKKLANLRDIWNQEKQSYNPEMLQAQQRLLEADEKLRDLIPDVSSAYDYAHSLLPDEAKERQEAWFQEAQKVSKEPIALESPSQPRTASLTGPVERTAGVPGQGPVEGEKTGWRNGIRLDDEASREQTERFTDAQRVSAARMQPVEGTGKLKAAGLAKGLEADAIEKGITEGFGSLPWYQQVSMADQARLASEIVTGNYNQAKRIAMGEEAPPPGVLPESVLVALEKHAVANGDIETIRELATLSSLSGEATTMGQRIRSLAERDTNSPTSVIREVQEARKQKLSKGFADREGKLQKGQKDTIESIKTAIKKRITTPEELRQFIKDIECDY